MAVTATAYDILDLKCKKIGLSNEIYNLILSLKVLMSNCVDDLNNMAETKAEIKKRLDSFEHIKESQFLCARRINKQTKGM